ncbi:MAG: nucleic acid-binding protein [Treponema sp.]|nr:nucleic acid-binding protein [Treponema sp.]
MATAETFENLKNLQEILVQKYDLEKKVSDAPKQLSNQEELLSKTRKEFIEQKNAYDLISDKVSRLKVELDEAVRSREEGEKGVANSTTHREYEALEKQISEAKDKEDDVRRELQKEEKELLALDERLKITEESINFSEQELRTSRESIDNEIAGYNERLSQLREEEDKITPNLKQETLFKFQRIIQRNSEGIVAVRNGVCTGCHMILPANFANEVREAENNGDKDILFCPYCSRILYYEEVSEDQQEDYFDIGVAGSLAGFDEDFDDEDETEDDDERDGGLGEYDSSDSDDDDSDSADSDEESEEDIEEDEE